MLEANITNSAKCNAEKVVATIRKRVREEVETVPTLFAWTICEREEEEVEHFLIAVPTQPHKTSTDT